MATVLFRISDEHARGLKALAVAQGTTTSKLMRQLAEAALQVHPAPVSGKEPAKRGRKGQVDVRLSAEAFAVVDGLAASEQRTVPAWIRALVETRLDLCLPFNHEELKALRDAVDQLARVGRNLNTLVHHIHRAGRGDPADVRVEELHTSVREVAYQVMAVRDRALGRYGQGADEG